MTFIIAVNLTVRFYLILTLVIYFFIHTSAKNTLMRSQKLRSDANKISIHGLYILCFQNNAKYIGCGSPSVARIRSRLQCKTWISGPLNRIVGQFAKRTLSYTSIQWSLMQRKYIVYVYQVELRPRNISASQSRKLITKICQYFFDISPKLRPPKVEEEKKKRAS